MAFELKPLPFDLADLEPLMSRRTLEFHYGKHHAGYVKKLNELTQGTPFADMPLEGVIQATVGKGEQKTIFNNAAQIWNHDFFWQCLKPSGGAQPKGPLADALKREFGEVNQFVDKFARAAVAQFGSGYAWLVLDKGRLKIVATHDADQPMTMGQQALFTCDVWEHAYYLDYQNEREKFVRTVIEKLVNWSFVGSRFDQFAAVA